MAFIVFFLVQKMTIPSGDKRGQSFIVQVSLVSLNRRSATRRLRNRYSTCPLSVPVRSCAEGHTQDFLRTSGLWGQVGFGSCPLPLTCPLSRGSHSGFLRILGTG